MGMDGYGGLTPAEAVLLNGQNQNCCHGNNNWGDGGFMWVFFLFFLLAWGGDGFGGFGRGNGQQAAWTNGALTRADLQEGFSFNDLQRSVAGVQNGLCDGFYAQAQNISNLNTAMLQGFNASQMGMMQGFNGVQAGLTAVGTQIQECCCNTQNGLQQLAYENAKNTCDIINAQSQNTQRIIDIMTQNQIQDLRDRLSDANMQLSNQAQSANLIDALRPVSRPAYITCSPYQAMPFNGNGCGCGYNCGC